jgi:hypothetical protein
MPAPVTTDPKLSAVGCYLTCNTVDTIVGYTHDIFRSMHYSNPSFPTPTNCKTRVLPFGSETAEERPPNVRECVNGNSKIMDETDKYMSQGRECLRRFD